MNIKVRYKDDVVVAKLEGRLHRGVGDEALRGLIDDALADGYRKLLLDLSEVRSIDSSGIGELVQGYKVAKELKAEIKILSLPQGVEHALRLTQILPLFEIFETEAEALASFQA